MRVEVLGVADYGFGIDDVDEGLGREVSGAFALGGLEGGLCLVVLAHLGLDVVVDALYLLSLLSAVLIHSTRRIRLGLTLTHLLQSVYEVCNGLVGPVLDLVPLEVAQVLINRLYIM